MLDCSDANLNLISDRDNIDAFARELVLAIDMVPFGDPLIANFGSGNKAGFTLVQLIETSNICAHFVDESRSIYLDVFSCKEFEPDIVVNMVRKYFNVGFVIPTFIKRQAK